MELYPVGNWIYIEAQTRSHEGSLEGEPGHWPEDLSEKTSHTQN